MQRGLPACEGALGLPRAPPLAAHFVEVYAVAEQTPSVRPFFLVRSLYQSWNPSGYDSIVICACRVCESIVAPPRPIPSVRTKLCHRKWGRRRSLTVGKSAAPGQKCDTARAVKGVSVIQQPIFEDARCGEEAGGGRHCAAKVPLRGRIVDWRAEPRPEITSATVVRRMRLLRCYSWVVASPQLQHYVPRFILRRFRTASQDAVHVHDKHAGRSFVASTRKVGAEKGLYDFEFDGEDLTLEPGLAEIEGRAAQQIDQILKDGHLHPVNALERSELAQFFAVQLVRTPAHRVMWRELEVRMEAHLRREGMREGFFAIDPRLGSRENADRVLIAGTMMNAPENFAPALIAKDWLLMKTDSTSSYIIGDHPLVMHNARDHGLRGNLGLSVQGIEIYFPLSPQLTLGMMCESHRRDFESGLRRMSRKDRRDPRLQKGISIARDFISAVQSGQLASMDPQNVEFLNSLQVTRAERFLFSCEGNFSVAEKMIAANPHLRRGPRIEEATGKF